jgi:hypothetical protein
MVTTNRRTLLRAAAGAVTLGAFELPSRSEQTPTFSPSVPKAVVTFGVSQPGAKAGRFELGLSVVISDEQGQTIYSTSEQIGSFSDLETQVKTLAISSAKDFGFTLEAKDILLFGGPTNH